MNKAKINKYIEFATTKIKIMYKEKKFIHEGRNIKYMIDINNNSDDLIVIFSGIPRPGIKARYNYGSTLKDFNVNKLFILDDLGYDQRGGYYLGKDKDFYMERGVVKLIDKIKNDLSIKRTIYCGSSKGGWASLYFGIRDNNSHIVTGSLQHLLGNYITSNERMSNNIMAYVMGKNYTQDDVDYLNSLLKTTLEKYKTNVCDIRLHYSDEEYTYEDHMVHLIKDLNDFGFPYSEDVAHYSKHEELAYYFPPFLIKEVNEILSM